MHPYFRVALQLSFGPLIGSTISKSDLLGLKRMGFPVAVLLFCMLSLNILFGLIMYWFSALDFPTTLFATAPGGMMDMAIISADLGANYVYVALLQLSRILFIVMFMIPFYKKLLLKFKPEAVIIHEPVKKEASQDALAPVTVRKKGIKDFLLTVLCSVTLGLILWQTGIPAGAIIGSMFGAGIFNTLTNRGYFPKKMRLPLQILAGAFIGMRMDRAGLLAMTEIIVPLIFVFITVIAMTLITAFVVHKLTGLDVFTCLIASTPGGLGEMALLAEELQIDPAKVVVMHTARLMSVIALFPAILTLVLFFLNS